ncbi:MAG TPA: peptidase MA family metallohydrolase [Thermomicrobiales bacterium]|nr:peptidase MA family metallohydrolase [Thermomicrobiales bacterium]
MRLLVFVLAISGFAVAVAPGPVAAQTDAVFSEMNAEAEFGQSLTFGVTVESAATIEEAELYWHAAGDLELSAEFPEIEPGQTVQIDHEVDLSFDYLPPGLDIVYFWRIIDSEGNATDSEELVLFYMDDGPDWESLTNGLVTLWWYSGNQEFGEDILETANRTIESLAVRFDVSADEPIRIVIYGNDDDFMAALPPNSADWIGGQAHPALNLIVAQIQLGSGVEREVRRMIPHEVSHLILHQATENPWNSPPNWLDEGLAVYNQETPDSDLPRILDDAIEDGELIPVSALGSSFPVDPEQAYLSYAESHSIVTYIVEELGEAELAELIAIFRDEVSYDEAVERALGMTVEELDAAWKAWLGYEGDSQPTGNNTDADTPPRPQTDVDEDTDLSRNELIGFLACTGVMSLGGLALFVVALRKVRTFGGSS